MIRQAAVSGSFYPAEPGELTRTLASCFADANPASGNPKAMIVPHAGYVYSGPIAASAYALLHPRAELIKRVILLGPSHRVALRGLAAPSAAYFATPLGHIAIDQRAIATLADLPQVVVRDDAHAQEHSLEVHLPFLQTVLKNFKLVPLVVGVSSSEEVAQVLERLWGGDETLIVVSSDLSHYLDYEAACTLDAATSKAIEALDGNAISDDGACGRYPARGLLAVAKRKGLHARAIDVRNSGDTAGSKDHVVGYGSYIFE